MRFFKSIYMFDIQMYISILFLKINCSALSLHHNFKKKI